MALQRKKSLKRKKPLRSGVLRAAKARIKEARDGSGKAQAGSRTLRYEWCPGCKVGRMVPGDITVSVEVAPGYSYLVPVRQVLVCEECKQARFTKQQRVWVDQDAYRQHREVVLQRDGYACCRCGAQGVQVEVAHRVGVSRARNPGREKHALSNLETCCLSCHRREHS